MNTMLNIGIAIISPALIISVMIFMINSVNKRIDDLRSEMKSDHAKLASALGDLASVVQGIDQRLENLNQTMTRHLEFHATNKS